MPNFFIDQNEFLTFFAVLVRFTVLMAVLPFLGDRTIPAPVKVLLGLAISVVLYPILVSTGKVDPSAAAVWGQTASGLVGTVLLEVIFALALGFTARIVFQAIAIGGDLVGTFMGFAAATQFDPHAETQTQIVSKFLTTLGMLFFLALDGHHLMLKAALESYSIVGIGKADLGGAFGEKLLALTSNIIRVGYQVAAPMAISLFSVNVVYGVMAKAMPQLNILILSFSVSAFIGLVVIFGSLSEFHDLVRTVFGDIHENMGTMMVAMSGG